MEKEKLSAMAYANESFAKDLLDVLDALEAAINVECHDEISLKIKEGVQNTLDLFLKNLKSMEWLLLKKKKSSIQIYMRQCFM